MLSKKELFLKKLQTNIIWTFYHDRDDVEELMKSRQLN
jgi:hypothetical protein